MAKEERPSPRTRSLGRLLDPQSIALVGASDKPGALGASVLENLDRFGFSGPVHLINPKRESIGGRKCLPSISDLPRGVDVAVLAIPSAAVLDAVRGLAERDAGAVVIFSAGFAEGGEAGLAAQREVAEIANRHGMAVLGPNCLGLTNYAKRTPLTFVEMHASPAIGAGSVGIVSQSGAMAVVLGTMLAPKELPVSLFVSTGNEAATGVEDYVEHLIDDPDLRVLAMIVEQFRNPRRFLAAASRAAAAGKTIVLLHPGRSAAARDSAATHTGALAGDWELMRVKVAQAHVILADGLEMLADAVDIVFRCGTGLTHASSLLTESGAYKALALDVAEAVGLSFPAPGDATRRHLRAGMPDFIPVSNPMDLTAQGLVDPDLYRRTMAPLVDDDAFGSVMLGIIQTDAKTAAKKFPPIIDAIRAIKPDKPVMLAGLDEGAPVPKEYASALRALNVPYFPAPDRMMRAAAAVAARKGIASHSAPRRHTASPLMLSGGVTPEYRAKQLLAEAGIPFPPGAFAATLDEAKSAARQLGYPVALKAQAAALPHKSDAGGVALNIANETALIEAWRTMFESVGRHAPEVTLDGVLVEAMSRRGLELIVGGRNDAEWGAVVLVGFGGVQAEVLKDVRLLPAGLPADAIVSELRKLKAGVLLDGWRGSPPLDVNAVAALAIALGDVLQATPNIREIDLNPVIVFPDGEGVLALDALIFSDPINQ